MMKTTWTALSLKKPTWSPDRGIRQQRVVRWLWCSTQNIPNCWRYPEGSPGWEEEYHSSALHRNRPVIGPGTSSLTRYPRSLLATIIATSITHEDLPTITLLLSIDPPPGSELKRVLSKYGGAISTRITPTNSPQIRSLLVRHGYQKIDRFELPFD